MVKGFNKYKRWILLVEIILFMLTLYWVELSPLGSEALKQYNGGYGTFDMKSYDAATVEQILSIMQPQGFKLYMEYLVGDYLFILTFGTLQFTLLIMLYSWMKPSAVKKAILCVPILRGVCDFVENTLLCIILKTYPIFHPNLVRISSNATFLKLMLIKLWIILLLAGIAMV